MVEPRDEGPDDERDVRSVVLEDEDGNPVVIEQQNVGLGREVGAGEFPDPDEPPTDPGEAAAEGEALDADADAER
jgi:hypothetical protein